MGVSTLDTAHTTETTERPDFGALVFTYRQRGTGSMTRDRAVRTAWNALAARSDLCCLK